MSARRAPAWLVLLFGLAVATAVLLTGPLLLFVPPFVSFEQSRHDVPALLGTDLATVDRATTSMLGDLLLGGDFEVSIDGVQPVLDEAERSHMRDVGGVVRGLILATALALAIVIVIGRRLRDEPFRRGRAMVAAAVAIGTAAVLLGVFFAVAFDTAFAAFHAIFFAAGTWQFGPDSNLLRFFPEPFWYEIALRRRRHHPGRRRPGGAAGRPRPAHGAPERPRPRPARLHSDHGRRSFSIGRVLGIRIALHPTWLVIAFLVTYALAAGDLPARFPGWIAAAYVGGRGGRGDASSSHRSSPTS